MTQRLGRVASPIRPLRPEPAGGVLVTLRASDAPSGQISIAGDFNNWQPTPMQREGDSWVVRLPVGPGVYHYAFRSATGTWFVPSSTPGRRDDGMGGHVAVLDGELMTDARDPAREDGRIDADIVARVLAGDTEQYASIVERYQRALYRHAVAMVLDHDAAADMVQDAFVRAYTNLKECRDPRRFRAWLFQTLRNRCLDYLKEPRRRHLRFDDAEPLLSNADGPAAFVDRRELRIGYHACPRSAPAGPAGSIRHALRGRSRLRDDGRRARRLGQCVEDACTSRPSGAECRAAHARCDRSPPLARLHSRRSDTRFVSMTAFRGGDMKFRIGLGVMILALAGLDLATAQVQPPQDRINTALARARQVGIPVALLESKIAEGKAKGVSLDRIAEAVERRQASARKGEPGVARSAGRRLEPVRRCRRGRSRRQRSGVEGDRR